ncbi:adenosylmethionine decarboxylase [Paucibacter sp. B2R-40]|jgi:S-adenosylmethionine decarboxylase proenzyme|uniref:adenosylmethionine decarboxylase n=1 Tax=Paucibacter sp. B2R-40 TaxID=2893554 RepID=UPI0021E4B6A4|nr:adenosylmethionine decarboxylase [Paucibacter sp. B2R-40]MCV2354208.1 adenosylmethionine decarboxylase [Paucibacter sp. B2R-40]
MQGLHLTADLSGVQADHALMLEPAALQALCVDAVAQAGLGAVAELFHRFTPAEGETQSGITGVVLLAESHLAVHTWPELGSVTLDVYVCNMGQDNSVKGQVLMARLISAFGPTNVQQQALQRGGLL